MPLLILTRCCPSSHMPLQLGGEEAAGGCGSEKQPERSEPGYGLLAAVGQPGA
uniref:Uncharacterized protein n=1 Tax=Arundo donax TaxID=35708 RepID=A0A0A8Y7A4_ARUDO